MELAEGGLGWGAVMRSDGWMWQWGLVVGSGGQKCMKAAPTLLPAFDPSEKRRTSLSDGGRGKTRSGL